VSILARVSASLAGALERRELLEVSVVFIGGSFLVEPAGLRPIDCRLTPEGCGHQRSLET
jgi:hypothetical protein